MSRADCSTCDLASLRQSHNRVALFGWSRKCCPGIGRCGLEFGDLPLVLESFGRSTTVNLEDSASGPEFARKARALGEPRLYVRGTRVLWA